MKINSTTLPSIKVPASCTIGIVAASFHRPIIKGLIEGAEQTLAYYQVAKSQTSIYRVPGAFEIPQMVRFIRDQKKPSAIIALGAVIRGQTPHFEYVSSACMDGLMQISLQNTNDCVICSGIITADTLEQAYQRAYGSLNRAVEATVAALQMIATQAEVMAGNISDDSH